MLITTRPRIVANVLGAMIAGACILAMFVDILNPIPWLLVPLANLVLAVNFGIIKEIHERRTPSKLTE